VASINLLVSDDEDDQCRGCSFRCYLRERAAAVLLLLFRLSTLPCHCLPFYTDLALLKIEKQKAKSKLKVARGCSRVVIFTVILVL
jgi:hypothetical protein